MIISLTKQNDALWTIMVVKYVTQNGANSETKEEGISYHAELS